MARKQYIKIEVTSQFAHATPITAAVKTWHNKFVKATMINRSELGLPDDRWGFPETLQIGKVLYSLKECYGGGTGFPAWGVYHACNLPDPMPVIVEQK